MVEGTVYCASSITDFITTKFYLMDEKSKHKSMKLMSFGGTRTILQKTFKNSTEMILK